MCRLHGAGVSAVHGTPVQTQGHRKDRESERESGGDAPTLAKGERRWGWDVSIVSYVEESQVAQHFPRAYRVRVREPSHWHLGMRGDAQRERT